jgi:hypothetical protein
MDIVKSSIKSGTGSSQREGSALGSVPASAPSAKLRAPMIFLIAIPAIRTGAKPFGTFAGIISNRHSSGALASTQNDAIPKNGDSSRIECGKMIGSTKGESALI